MSGSGKGLIKSAEMVDLFEMSSEWTIGDICVDKALWENKTYGIEMPSVTNMWPVQEWNHLRSQTSFEVEKQNIVLESDISTLHHAISTEVIDYTSPFEADTLVPLAVCQSTIGYTGSMHSIRSPANDEPSSDFTMEDLLSQDLMETATHGFVRTESAKNKYNQVYSQPDVVSPLPRHPKTRNFTCTINGCGRSYKRRYELQRHQKSHYNTRPYACKVSTCHRADQSGFARRDHLMQHMRQVHQE